MDEISKVSRHVVMAAYNERYKKLGDLRESDAFYRWVLGKLSPGKGKNLLDVACGEGHLIKWARQYELRSVGLDIAFNAVSIAQQVAGANVVTVADGERLPFADESFDYVTNMGSLEHFISPLSALKEIHRVLRPSGYAAIFLPNSYYLVDIIWHVWRTGYSVSHRQVVERFATFHEWRDFLEQGVGKVVRAYNYNFRFPRTSSDWEWYRQRPRKLLNLLVAPVIPFNLSYSFLYICAKN